jgi:hypothetical protein
VSYEPDVLFDNFAQRLAQYGSVEGVLAGLRREGFTHILVNQFVYPWIVADFPITPEEQIAWDSFQAKYLTADAIVHTEEPYLVLYRLPSEAEP